MSIFLDASFWVALANQNDHHHARAQEIAKELTQQKYGRPITSDHVFDESLGVTLRKSGLNEAQELGYVILESEAMLLTTEKHYFDLAWQTFSNQNGHFSFTDCSILAIMKILSINYIASFDKEFENIKGINVIK